MREIKGNLWDYFNRDGYIVCITTNGTVRKDGCAVMGRGCAAQAKHRIPGIDATLGRNLRLHGNRLTFLGNKMTSFPVKHNWYERADLALIERSATELSNLARQFPHVNYILPRPGCGNGQRQWELEVKTLIEGILPDNVWVISKEAS